MEQKNDSDTLERFAGTLNTHKVPILDITSVEVQAFYDPYNPVENFFRLPSPPNRSGKIDFMSTNLKKGSTDHTPPEKKRDFLLPPEQSIPRLSIIWVNLGHKNENIMMQTIWQKASLSIQIAGTNEDSASLYESLPQAQHMRGDELSLIFPHDSIETTSDLSINGANPGARRGFGMNMLPIHSSQSFDIGGGEVIDEAVGENYHRSSSSQSRRHRRRNRRHHRQQNHHPRQAHNSRHQVKWGLP